MLVSNVPADRRAGKHTVFLSGWLVRPLKSPRRLGYSVTVREMRLLHTTRKSPSVAVDAGTAWPIRWVTAANGIDAVARVARIGIVTAPRACASASASWARRDLSKPTPPASRTPPESTASRTDAMKSSSSRRPISGHLTLQVLSSTRTVLPLRATTDRYELVRR
jgi:hypothetical protein